MHEFPITQSIVKISSEEAEKHGAARVLEVRIKVGEFSGLVPDCIQSYFDIVSKGTVAEGAVLKIEKIPISIKCEDCGFESGMNLKTFNCSKCGSFKVKITGGREFYIDSMEVE